MADIEKVIKGLECCTRYEVGKQLNNCLDCPYVEPIGFNQFRCKSQEMKEDALELLKEQKEERKRMLSWLSKFCRHIDNGDKWLTDEENLAFFKGKMKQQFGWDTD